MGLCVSNPCRGLNAQDHHVKKRIRPERLGVENRFARTRVMIADGWTQAKAPVNIRDAPCIAQRRDSSDHFHRASWSGTSTINGTSGSQESRESHSNSFVSSSESEFDSAELETYDGLNMRATNRYDIGLEILKAKIHHGADPKTLITHGERSCLMFAVMANDFSYTKELVKLGVDVNYSNSSGESALSLAIDMQRKDIAYYLRSKGALLQ